MAIIQPLDLSKLSESEIKEIIYRKSLDLDKVMSEVIVPLATDLKINVREKLIHYTLKWDKVVPEKLVLQREELKESFEKLKKEQPEVIAAFQMAANNITLFHQQQVPRPLETTVAENILGLKFIPFDRVCLYVPGGKARYPSTVLMGVLPAKIAGVKDITIASPPDPLTGSTPEIVKAITYLAGADRLLQAGGAQAIIAMGYGIHEESIKPVDFIYGPGNVFVSAAKNYLFSGGFCGIDSFAGPSEVLIIADEHAEPRYLAHDFMAQAEHDENAAAILLTTSEQSAKDTIIEIEKALSKRKDRVAITAESIKRNGKIIVVKNLDEAIDFSNEYAPEHLEIQTGNNDYVLEKITSAGSIFVGDQAPVAIGDYYSGTNHILPTNRGARFSSGVSVHSFYKRVTYQKITRKGLELSLDPITIMSTVEGLYDEHGYSVATRFES